MNIHKIILVILLSGVSFLYVNSQIAISNVSDLQKIGNDDEFPLTESYYLTTDIDLSEIEEWVPIGASSPTDGDPQQFKGEFDGRGYSIKNLKISTVSNFKGLFGRLYHAVVKDVDLVDVDITGGNPVGGVSGAMIGSSVIERVSVSGNIQGASQVGGIVGRIARDPTHTDYNVIHDCYVNANIKATSKSTDMNNPSCAGGIAAFSHSTEGNSISKADIQRVYVTGSVISEQDSHVAGNASGILTFYDFHKNIIMDEVLVLCDTIGAATSNLFFSRRGPTYNEFDSFDKVYARTGIELYYLEDNDRGRGGEIPDGVINYNPIETFQTVEFYQDNLSWDFEDVWTMKEGSLPILKRPKNNDPETYLKYQKNTKQYQILIQKSNLIIQPEKQLSVQVFDLIGTTAFSSENLTRNTKIKLNSGIYIVNIIQEGYKFTEKIIIK